MGRELEGQPPAVRERAPGGPGLAGALLVAAKSGQRKKYPALFNAWRVTAGLLAAFAVYAAIAHVPSAITAGSVKRLDALNLVASAKEMIGDQKNFPTIAASETAGQASNGIVDLKPSNTPAPSASGASPILWAGRAT